MPAHKQFKHFDRYVEEADLPPFLLPVSEEETIEIRCPTGEDIDLLNQAFRTGDGKLMIAAAFGEQADRVWELVGPKPFPVTRAILDDVLDHFGIGGESLGESRASSP